MLQRSRKKGFATVPGHCNGIFPFKFGLNTSKADLEILNNQRFTETTGIQISAKGYQNLAVWPINQITELFIAAPSLQTSSKNKGKMVTKPPSSATDTKG